MLKLGCKVSGLVDILFIISFWKIRRKPEDLLTVFSKKSKYPNMLTKIVFSGNYMDVDNHTDLSADVLDSYSI